MKANKGPANWRARFFWSAEIIYAIIGGIFEADVYRAYSPPGADAYVAWASAIARATITQVVIVFIGVAAIELWKGARGSWFVKLLASLPAQGLAFGAACVAYYLMRIAVLASRNPAALNGADALPLTLPFLGTIDGVSATVSVIAGLPFFQMVMNILGPAITREPEHLTVAQIQERAAAEAAQVEANLRLLALRARGVRGVVVAGLGREKSEAPESKPQGLDNDNPQGSDGATYGVLTSLPGGKGQLPHARGPWNRLDLLAYVALTYPGVSISDTEALNVIRTLGNGRKKGTGYVASITQVKAWAKRTYGGTTSGDLDTEAAS